MLPRWAWMVIAFLAGMFVDHIGGLTAAAHGLAQILNNL